MIPFVKQLFDQKKKRRYFNSGNQHTYFPPKYKLHFTFTKTVLVKCKKREYLNYSTNGFCGRPLALSAYTSSLTLQSDFNLPKKICYLLHWKPFKIKMMKKAFYFILKALFVLEIFKFSSWLSVSWKNGLIRKRKNLKTIDQEICSILISQKRVLD